VAAAGLTVVLGIALAATAAHGPPARTVRATGGPPPMGWSSWSFLRKHPTAASIEAQAAAMNGSGRRREPDLGHAIARNVILTYRLRGRGEPWLVWTLRRPVGEIRQEIPLHRRRVKSHGYIT
jgi:hypothetical protein